MARCKQCLLPEEVSNASFDKKSFYSICRNYTAKDSQTREDQRKLFEKDLNYSLLNCKGSKAYDYLVCYITAPLTDGYALKIALEKSIHLVLTGHSLGQPDENWMFYERPPSKIANHHWTPNIINNSGCFSKKDLALFWNPQKISEGAKLLGYNSFAPQFCRLIRRGKANRNI